MSSNVDIAAPGIGLPEGDEGEEQAGLWRRAYDNLRTGNLGIVPIVIGLAFIVVFFSFKATNFFTADNFNNIIVQMAGLTMLAFGVVFVLLLGEIDLSIGYLSGIAALAVAEFQLPGSGHAYPGIVAIAIAVGLCAFIGGVQGSVVAKVGVPSFVVTLAGLLIWQGVILQVLEIKGVIVIQDYLINDLANYYFTANRVGSSRPSSRVSTPSAPWPASLANAARAWRSADRCSLSRRSSASGLRVSSPSPSPTMQACREGCRWPAFSSSSSSSA